MLIKSINGNLLFEGDYASTKEAVQAANRFGLNLRFADLSDANLRGADLRNANLSGATLRDADLWNADLRGANLSGANLRNANLRGATLRNANLGGATLRNADLWNADLRGANLRGANLSGANLRNANLRRATLRNANLSGATLRDADLWNADLRGANLMAANLTEIKSDFIGAISKLPNEVQNLRDAIIVGKIDGSTYEGECACLAGTIANNIGLNYKELPEVGFMIDCYSPRERWFFGIKKGDTPENSQISAITLEWIDEFLAKNKLSFVG